jgi:hypothetical protein
MVEEIMSLENVIVLFSDIKKNLESSQPCELYYIFFSISIVNTQNVQNKSAVEIDL